MFSASTYPFSFLYLSLRYTSLQHRALFTVHKERLSRAEFTKLTLWHVIETQPKRYVVEKQREAAMQLSKQFLLMLLTTLFPCDFYCS